MNRVLNETLVSVVHCQRPKRFHGRGLLAREMKYVIFFASKPMPFAIHTGAHTGGIFRYVDLQSGTGDRGTRPIVDSMSTGVRADFPAIDEHHPRFLSSGFHNGATLFSAIANR